MDVWQMYGCMTDVIDIDQTTKDATWKFDHHEIPVAKCLIKHRKYIIYLIWEQWSVLQVWDYLADKEQRRKNIFPMKYSINFDMFFIQNKHQTDAVSHLVWNDKDSSLLKGLKRLNGTYYAVLRWYWLRLHINDIFLQKINPPFTITTTSQAMSIEKGQLTIEASFLSITLY